MKKKESKPVIREMLPGEMRCFPIKSRRTIRTNVSDLNGEYASEGKRWESSSDVDQGVVWVRRNT